MTEELILMVGKESATFLVSGSNPPLVSLGLMTVSEFMSMFNEMNQAAEDGEDLDEKAKELGIIQVGLDTNSKQC